MVHRRERGDSTSYDVVPFLLHGHRALFSITTTRHCCDGVARSGNQRLTWVGRSQKERMDFVGPAGRSLNERQREWKGER